MLLDIIIDLLEKERGSDHSFIRKIDVIEVMIHEVVILLNLHLLFVSGKLRNINLLEG